MNKTEIKLFKGKEGSTALLTLEADTFATNFRPDGTVLLVIDMNEKQTEDFLEGIINQRYIYKYDQECD